MRNSKDKAKQLSKGPDIPSINLLIHSKAQFDESTLTKHSVPISVPQISLKHKNPTKALYGMPLPEKFKDLLPDNQSQLIAYYKKKKENEKLLKKREHTKQKKIPISVDDRMKVIEQRLKDEKLKVQEKNIKMDSKGRVVDNDGNVKKINHSTVVSTKLNQQKSKEEKIKELLKPNVISQSSYRDSEIFDRNITLLQSKKKLKQKNNAFHFIEEGSILKKAEILRAKAKNYVRSTGSARLTTDNFKKRHKKRTAKKHFEPIPDIEWWDRPLLGDDCQNYIAAIQQNFHLLEQNNASAGSEKNTDTSKVNSNLQDIAQQFKISNAEIVNMSNESRDKTETTAQDVSPAQIQLKSSAMSSINNMNFLKKLENLDSKLKINLFPLKNGVVHGKIIKAQPFPSNSTPIVLPMPLTDKEQKQKRRKEREKKTKEKRELIKLGLAKPPPQKLKLTNFMQLLMSEAVADPTKIEMEVKKNIADRLKAHLDRNEERKLTKEQKKEKIQRKLKKDVATECKTAVFLVKDLSNLKHRFKVEKNARQLALTGFIFISMSPDYPSVIIAEGGSHSIKFYRKLMTRRIKWTFDENGVENNLNNLCKLIWEGVQKDRNFNRLQTIEFYSENDIRKVLVENKMENLWDIALDYESAISNQTSIQLRIEHEKVCQIMKKA